MGNKRPKIVLIGAGSLFFGRQAIWAVNNLSGLKGCILSLVDTNPTHLEKMSALARLAVKTAGTDTRIEAHSDFRDALPGADFVVLSFSTRNTYYRRIDCQISAKYGIRMCSGDTIGPGGVFRAMRDFPRVLEIAHAMEELCPEAWLINYVNPTAIMGIGLMRHSKVRSFALCDTHHMPKKKLSYLEMIGEDEAMLERFDCRIAGVNHFTWMLKAELGGCDVMPRIKEAFRSLGALEKDEGYAKARFSHFITAELTDLFGVIPTCTGHTKEYLPFYQGRAAIQEPIPPLSVFDCDERDRWVAAMWEEIDDYLAGRKPMADFHANSMSDHATDVINTMLTGDGRTYFINCPNNGCIEGGGRAVSNLPEDAFLELECQLDANGPHPLPVGEFPLGLRGLQMLILDLHELTVEAIVKRDRQLLVRALAIDPLVNSIATAKAVIDELITAQKEVLPGWTKEEEEEVIAAPLPARAIVAPQLY